MNRSGPPPQYTHLLSVIVLRLLIVPFVGWGGMLSEILAHSKSGFWSFSLSQSFGAVTNLLDWRQNFTSSSSLKYQPLPTIKHLTFSFETVLCLLGRATGCEVGRENVDVLSHAAQESRFKKSLKKHSLRCKDASSNKIRVECSVNSVGILKVRISKSGSKSFNS